MIILSTGSQGEPLSALRRMAYRDHPQVKLHEGDTVVFSATPIPGNERAVNDTIDRLYHIGCEVITTHDAPIHASGHGYAEELKLMLNLTKPRYVMPFHGDYKRIQLHAALAEAVGIDRDAIFYAENGDVLELDARGARFGKPEHAGMIFVDGVDIGDVADAALRDRRMLSADGIFIVVATISEQDGALGRRPRGHLPRRRLPRRGRPARSTRSRTPSRIRSNAPPPRACATSSDLQQLLHDHLGALIYERLSGGRWCFRSSSRSRGCGPRPAVAGLRPRSELVFGVRRADGRWVSLDRRLGGRPPPAAGGR